MCCICVSYHLRHLFCKRCWREEESESKTDFWEMIVRLLVLLSAMMTLLALIVACMLTHGHDWTCSGLRRYVNSQGLSPWLGISSSHVHQLFNRIDCGFFYAALDYGMQVGRVNNISEGGTIIDSNAALEVAMATGWFQFFFWLGLTAANIWLALRMKIDLFMSIPLPFLNKE